MKKREILVWSGTVYRGRESKCGDCKHQLVFPVPRPQTPCGAVKVENSNTPKAYKEGNNFFCEGYDPKLLVSVRNKIVEAAIFIRQLSPSLPI